MLESGLYIIAFIVGIISIPIVAILTFGWGLFFTVPLGISIGAIMLSIGIMFSSRLIKLLSITIFTHGAIPGLFLLIFYIKSLLFVKEKNKMCPDHTLENDCNNNNVCEWNKEINSCQYKKYTPSQKPSLCLPFKTENDCNKQEKCLWNIKKSLCLDNS